MSPLLYTRNPSHRNYARGSIVRVGAPPASVEAGLPGARDEVRAYATRIDDAWKQFWADDVKPWSDSEIGGSEEPVEGESVIGEAIGSDPKAVAEKNRKIALYERIRNARTDFRAYRDEISSFSITGPTPSEAWQTLQTHENALNDAREQLQAETKAPLKSKKSAQPLEVAGGVKQGVAETLEKTAKTVGSAIPWTGIAIAAGVGLGAVLLLGKK